MGSLGRDPDRGRPPGRACLRGRRPAPWRRRWQRRRWQRRKRAPRRWLPRQIGRLRSTIRSPQPLASLVEREALVFSLGFEGELQPRPLRQPLQCQPFPQLLPAEQRSSALLAWQQRRPVGQLNEPLPHKPVRIGSPGPFPQFGLQTVSHPSAWNPPRSGSRTPGHEAGNPAGRRKAGHGPRRWARNREARNGETRATASHWRPGSEAWSGTRSRKTGCRPSWCRTTRHGPWSLAA